MLHVFHRSVMESDICYADISCGNSIKDSDSKKLKAGSVLGTDLEPPVLTVQKKTAAQLAKHNRQHLTSPKRHIKQQCPQSEASPGPLK